MKETINKIIHLADAVDSTSKSFKKDIQQLAELSNTTREEIIKQNQGNQALLKKAYDIPVVAYKPFRFSLVQILIIPFFIQLVSENKSRLKSSAQAKTISQKYSSINFLLGH